MSGKWRKVTTKRVTSKATGAYSCAYKPSKRGSWRIQASVAVTSDYTKAVSVWRTFTVK